MAMSEQRMGQIALALLMSKWDAEGGVKVGSEWFRKRGQIAKDTGISVADLDEFAKEVLVRQIGKAFGMKHVSLTMDEPIHKH